jgi:hypothetical protein
VLDLRAWKQARVWPRERPEEADVASSVERVAVALERTLVAAAATGTPNVGFTAGGDSRTFVACARDILDRFRFVTVAFPDELGAVDLATAPALAQRLGLEHRVLPWLEPSSDDVELFMYRTGCLVGERRGRLAGPSYDQFGGAETYVSGIGAEMARGIGWRRDDEPGSELSADGLLSRFHLRPHPELLRRAGEWLAELPPGFDALDALTIFHVEMRMGGWGGPLTAGFPDAYTFTLYPFANRTIVDTVLRLPWLYRRSGRLREDVIAVRWPELLEVRINRPPARIAARRRVRRGYVAARAAAGSLRRAVRRARGRRGA